MTTVPGVSVVPGLSVVPRVSLVLRVPGVFAVVAGVLPVPIVRGRVVSRGGQRVGDTHAVSGHRLPVRGLPSPRPARVTVSRVLVGVGAVAPALVWPVRCVIVARWRTQIGRAHV